METIEVKRKHIKRGVSRSTTRCPIALALREAGFKDVSVGYGSFETERCRWRLPKAATKFIERFDDDISVRPFKFRLPAGRPVDD